tara:strand:- start:283 stop:510 length:228 start_codon:yes stop_codon:yes gene_type:complete
MENKTGRKYDRERWGWGKLDEGKYDNEVSKLDGHSYYDSEEKLKKNRFASMVAGAAIVGMVVMIIVMKVMQWLNI